MTKLFKNGGYLGIETDAETEREFLDDIGKAFSALIESKIFKDDWEFQFKSWLPQVVDVCNFYHGNKSDVRNRMILSSGDTNATLVYPVSEDERVEYRKEREMKEEIIKEAKALCVKFIWKVDNEMARSTETYAECQSLLEKIIDVEDNDTL